MRLGPSSGSHVAFGEKKIKTLNNLPKVQSLDGRVLSMDSLPSKKQQKQQHMNTP
jgi:hypothetical protein